MPGQLFTLPTSQESQLIDKLEEYLKSKTNITDWQYYSNEHSAQMNAVGSIVIPRLKPVAQFNLDYLNKNFQFQLRVLVSNSDLKVLIHELLDWQGYLVNEVMRSLYVNGHEGYFKGIKWISSQVIPAINQDKGGTGALLLEYSWDDDSLTAGEQYGKFI